VYISAGEVIRILTGGSRDNRGVDFLLCYLCLLLLNLSDYLASSTQRVPEFKVVTAAVTPLLRVCYGLGVNFAPYLSRCYGCYGSKQGEGGCYPHRAVCFSGARR
jgi:hypothetical protein